jgi:hypothetical protein
LPWREPQTEDCETSSSYCDRRAKHTGYWLTRGVFHLNVGARF